MRSPRSLSLARCLWLVVSGAESERERSELGRDFACARSVFAVLGRALDVHLQMPTQMRGACFLCWLGEVEGTCGIDSLELSGW
jgi:hypothetical protein